MGLLLHVKKALVMVDLTYIGSFRTGGVRTDFQMWIKLTMNVCTWMTTDWSLEKPANMFKRIKPESLGIADAT